MKYERGSFIVVPSREKLRGMPVPAQALYMWLCAYANETGECFPARSTLARDCDCSLPTIDRMTQLLVDRGLLEVEKRVKNGENMTNLYTVVIWGGSNTDLPPGNKALQGVATQIDKELNPVLTETTEVSASARDLEEITIIDDSKPSKKEKKRVDEDVLEVFRAFGKYPKNWEANKTERGAAERLLEEHGLEKVKKALDFCKRHADDERFYQVLTPWDLDSKWVKLIAYAKKV